MVLVLSFLFVPLRLPRLLQSSSRSKPIPALRLESPFLATCKTDVPSHSNSLLSVKHCNNLPNSSSSVDIQYLLVILPYPLTCILRLELSLARFTGPMTSFQTLVILCPKSCFCCIKNFARWRRRAMLFGKQCQPTANTNPLECRTFGRI